MIDKWLAYFSEERIDRLHALGLEEYGGSAGRLHDGCVTGAVETAAMAAYYNNQIEPDIFIFAANLLYSLTCNHCYGDGNKRVAWKVFDRVFRHSGLQVVATDEEARQLVVNIADTVEFGWGPEDVIKWLQEEGRLVPADFIEAPEVLETGEEES